MHSFKNCYLVLANLVTVYEEILKVWFPDIENWCEFLEWIRIYFSNVKLLNISEIALCEFPV